MCEWEKFLVESAREMKKRERGGGRGGRNQLFSRVGGERRYRLGVVGSQGFGTTLDLLRKGLRLVHGLPCKY